MTSEMTLPVMPAMRSLRHWRHIRPRLRRRNGLH
jgi:hypothetical protein